MEPKPPIGLMPRDIWLSQRIDEIWRAIDRYTDADKSIPAAWMQELRDHQSPRDVLRVVEPEAVAQPEPEPTEPEPTGAELVGKRCEFWNTEDDHYHLVGECIEVGDGVGYRVSGGIWTMYAKLYREGVTP